MGGGGDRGPDTDVDTRALKQELATLRDPNSQEAQAISGLIGGQMSPEQAIAQRQALAAIKGGENAAIQGAREGAAARGLFSSDIGIGLEQNAIQNVAGQRAGIFQQRAQDVQQGLLSGLQASQQRAGLRGQLAQSITSGSAQSAQMAQSAFQARQKQSSNFGRMAGGLALSLIPGGQVAGAAMLGAGE